MGHITRRDVVRLGASAAAIGLAGAPFGGARADARLRMIWWGNPDRDRRTLAALDVYKRKRADVTVQAEATGWGDYWPKVATQAAGRNLPDVLQMDYRYIFEYARRGQLADLGPFVGREIDLAQFTPSLLDTGKVDGKLYGVPMGANSTSVVYNKTKLDALGIKMPDGQKWTLDDLRSIAQEIAGKTEKSVAAVANVGWLEQWLEVFVRQRGKALYTEDGKLGFGADDVAAFWDYWDGMQKAGLTPPPDVQALDDRNLDKKMIVLGKSLIDFTNSNQLVGLQKLVQDELALTMIPNQAERRPGQYMKPAMLISAAANGPSLPEAAKLISFMISDLDAADTLEVERGVPGDARVRQRLQGKIGKVEERMVAYLEAIGEHVSPIPPPPPKGAGEIENLLLRLHQQVSFGRAKVPDGARDFVRQAETILRRA